MDILCPNCKQPADLHKIEGADYIECPDCGWFKVQADSTFVACDDPPGPEKKQDPTIPEPELAHGEGPASTSEGIQPKPSDKPGLDEPEFDEDYVPAALDEDDPDYEDEDEIKVVVTFED